MVSRAGAAGRDARARLATTAATAAAEPRLGRGIPASGGFLALDDRGLRKRTHVCPDRRDRAGERGHLFRDLEPLEPRAESLSEARRRHGETLPYPDELPPADRVVVDRNGTIR